VVIGCRSEFFAFFADFCVFLSPGWRRTFTIVRDQEKETAKIRKERKWDRAVETAEI